VPGGTAKATARQAPGRSGRLLLLCYIEKGALSGCGKVLLVSERHPARKPTVDA